MLALNCLSCQTCLVFGTVARLEMAVDRFQDQKRDLIQELLQRVSELVRRVVGLERYILPCK